MFRRPGWHEHVFAVWRVSPRLQGLPALQTSGPGLRAGHIICDPDCHISRKWRVVQSIDVLSNLKVRSGMKPGSEYTARRGA